MSAQPQELDELIRKLKARERASWRSSLLWTIVPAALAFAFLGYASYRLTEVNEEVAALQQRADAQRTQVVALHNEAEQVREQAREARTEAEQLRQQARQARNEAERSQARAEALAARIGAMQDEIRTLREKLQETLDMSKFEYPVDMVDLKTLYSRHREAGELLDRIFTLRREGVGWHLGGQTPERGFDSPGFAAYVLKQAGRLPREPGESLLAASRQLAQRLEPTDDPGMGDLAIYPAGYHLFVFENKDRRRYVIGMTPAGIVALRPDFAKVLGYRKVR